MNRFRLLCIGALFFSGILSAQQFSDLSQKVPFDKAIRKGVLPNGLTYYIRHNEQPKASASFYIYQNVGSALEKDNQSGLAHFLEHMAFNGTNTFPGKNLLDMLERNGVKFGLDVNAYTATNETVYNISRVPTANEKIVDSCLIALRDWCDELTLDEKEIDAERGVIHEEWRSRINAQSRIFDQISPVMYNGAIYYKRTPIGDMNVVKNFKPKALRDFYHDWYRTDLQAVAIVGDIDVDAIEKRVKELFSAIPPVKNPQKRPLITIPDNAKPLYTIGTDNDLNDVMVSLNIRHKVEYGNTLADKREQIVNTFFNVLLANRLKEIKSKYKVPFKTAVISNGYFERGYELFKISVTSNPGLEKFAFEFTLNELQRIKLHGFTEGELERLKLNYMASAENKYNKRDNFTSDSYCTAIKTAYMNGTSVPDAIFEYQFAKEIVPTITLGELKDYVTKFFTDKNQVYIVTGPERAKNAFPSLQDLTAIVAKVQKKDLKVYVDDTPTDVELLSEQPEGGKIISEKELKDFDAVEWKLSNGATVVYRFANYQKNNVALQAISEGGMSVYDTKDLPSCGAAVEFVKQFGIGRFNVNAYNKLMAGKTANSAFSISNTQESVSGASNTKDVETMMQLVYLRFQEPRFDETSFNSILKKKYLTLDTKRDMKAIIRDTVSGIINAKNPRHIKYGKNYLDKISFERLKEIYLDRFDGASDFTFFIVGDVNKDTIKSLVEKYIGSIKSTDRKETWKDDGDFYPHGKHSYKIKIPMEVPKSTVMVRFRADEEYSRQNVVYNSIIGGILDLRFKENIREKEGGTYGVSVNSFSIRYPKMNQGFEISFVCDPANAEHLKSLVYKEIDAIKKIVRKDDLQKVILNIKKNNDIRTESNDFWMSTLRQYYETKENRLDSSYLDTIINTVTVKDIEKAANSFFKKADVLDIVFYPES